MTIMDKENLTQQFKVHEVMTPTVFYPDLHVLTALDNQTNGEQHNTCGKTAGARGNLVHEKKRQNDVTGRCVLVIKTDKQDKTK